MTNTARTRVGANLRAEMARQGVSQMDLAARLGLGQSALSKRLRGAIAFDVDELTAAAAALNVPLDSLLAGVEGASA